MARIDTSLGRPSTSASASPRAISAVAKAWDSRARATQSWEDDVCTKYADAAATTIELFTGTTIATLFVKTTDECPNPGQGRCYAGSQFLKDQIASNTGLAQTAEWTDENLKFVVGTMADQIVATIC